MSSSYYSYRIFLNEPLRPNLFTHLVKKEDRFKELFKKVEEENKIVFSEYGTEYVFCYYKKINENIYIWQLGRKQEFSKPELLTKKIENVSDIKYPFIYLVFHIEKQIVFIQMDSSVFQSLETVKNKIENFITHSISEGGIIVHLTEISDQREFWTKINEMDSVQELEFDYNPPNFFRANKKFDNIVKEVFQETDFQKFKIFLQNKTQGLKFSLETFGEHISRLSSGAGNYIIRGIKDGIEYTLKSTAIPFKRQIPDIDKCKEEKLEDDFDEAHKLNDK